MSRDAAAPYSPESDRRQAGSQVLQAAEQIDEAYRSPASLAAPTLHLPEERLSPALHWLTLQGPPGSAGSLVQVCWIDDEGQRAWRRFLIFRAGYRDVVARTKLPGPMEGGEFVLWPIAAGRPQAEDAQRLLESFREASQYDPASVPLWQNWATSTLQAVDLDDALHPVLEKIARELPPGGRDGAGPSSATL